MRIAEAYRADKIPLSYEMFPPKGELTLEHAREVAEQFHRRPLEQIKLALLASGLEFKHGLLTYTVLLTYAVPETYTAYLPAVALTVARCAAILLTIFTAFSKALVRTIPLPAIS